jgi:hypothetical protein
LSTGAFNVFSPLAD